MCRLLFNEDIMNYQFSLNTPMQSIFWSKHDSSLKNALLIAAGVILLALASQLSIPLNPIPLTFQSAAAILIGMTYGSRKGAAVIACYFLAGACGLPVFANFSAGPTSFFSPSGGYLLGFLPAAFLSGYLMEKGWAKNIISSFAASLLGAAIIFTCGLAVLSTFTGWQTAITLGLMPFLISESIKLILVSALVTRLWKRD